MEGNATRKQVRITYHGPGGEGALNLVLLIPNGAKKPAPCFLLICNRPAAENIDPTRKVKSPFWPAEEIVARGYAAAAFFNGDVAPDKYDEFKSGVFAIYDTPPRAADAWGTIAAWAWGASRAMDYLVTDPAIDGQRVAVIGHSRGGKTALWAGAEDQRFAMVVSNDSGCTGAALARGKTGERIADINRVFPHWFNENYKGFGGREDALPVDQHMLCALIAPRLLCVASASEDAGADPKNEFLAAFYASPVFRLFGLEGLTSAVMPQAEMPLHDGHIGYHLRSGKHNLTEYDWNCFMDFADQHLGKPASAAP
jgi:pimeloyl-ACP methyl ester carboxylesterase